MAGLGAVAASEQKTHAGTSGQPRASISRRLAASRSKSSDASPTGIVTLRAFPDFGVVSPEAVMERRTVISRASKSMSLHWSPSASPRRIPVEKSSRSKGAKRGSRSCATSSRVSISRSLQQSTWWTSVARERPTRPISSPMFEAGLRVTFSSRCRSV
ncbi:MAG: hypothetical protein JRG96_14965 [Deltaproteobacteria bacterium]|nr:hypothetical protein [Deltaproteobacteria bacterium]